MSGHHHHAPESDRGQLGAVFINILLTLAQVIGGIISGSLSLIADALHNLSYAVSLGMAMHIGKGPGRAEKDEIPYRVFHGPAYRLVVDLADPLHAKFVIAGGNGGRADSVFLTNQYSS